MAMELGLKEKGIHFFNNKLRAFNPKHHLRMGIYYLRGQRYVYPLI